MNNEMNMVVFYHVTANSECQISSFGENQKQIESLEISSLPEKRGINTSHYKQVRSSPLPSQLLPREFLKQLRSGKHKSSGKFNSMFTEAY